jgi:hypothetical protein
VRLSSKQRVGSSNLSGRAIIFQIRVSVPCIVPDRLLPTSFNNPS